LKGRFSRCSITEDAAFFGEEEFKSGACGSSFWIGDAIVFEIFWSDYL